MKISRKAIPVARTAVTPRVAAPRIKEEENDIGIKIAKGRERASTLMSSAKMLLDEGFVTDFKVKVGDKTYPVHRLVLAASSEYFKAMLGHNMREASQGFVEIKGLDEGAVKACIDYLYTGVIEFDDVEAIEPVLKASDLLQITDLNEYLFEALLGKIDKETCLLIRQYGITYHSDVTTHACNAFLANNMLAVAMSDHWLWMSSQGVTECITLSKDKHTAKLWSVILRWVKHDQESRKAHIPEYLCHMAPLDVATTISLILMHPLVVENDASVCYILEHVVEQNISAVPRYIDMNNCFKLNSLAKKFVSEKTKGIVRDFMARNLQLLTESHELHELGYDDFLSVVTRPCNATEQSKFNVISAWAKDNDLRTEKFVKLFKQLDLSKVSPDFIQNVIRKNEMVSANSECSNILMDALYEHARGLQGYGSHPTVLRTVRANYLS